MCLRQASLPDEPPSRPEVDGKTAWKMPVDGSPIRGNPAAPVTLVMFFNFQCPFSRNVAPTIEGLEKKYGDQLRVVFKPHRAPLPPAGRARRRAPEAP